MKKDLLIKIGIGVTCLSIGIGGAVLLGNYVSKNTDTEPEVVVEQPVVEEVKEEPVVKEELAKEEVVAEPKKEEAKKEEPKKEEVKKETQKPQEETLDVTVTKETTKPTPKQEDVTPAPTPEPTPEPNPTPNPTEIKAGDPAFVGRDSDGHKVVQNPGGGEIPQEVVDEVANDLIRRMQEAGMLD